MSAAPPTPPPPDEEEIARLAALAALNETIPTNSSLFGNSSLTMQLQSEVFVLRHNFIDEADAIAGSTQSQHEVDGLYAEAGYRTIEFQNLSRP